MGERIARDVRVTGRVQGVFFRASTRERAEAAGVAGWVRNDPDGSVRVHLEGAEEAVTDVLQWIRGGGPPRARVDGLEVTEAVVSGTPGFEVARGGGTA